MADIKKQVAVPHTCRIQTRATAVPDAPMTLSAMAGVTADRHAHQADELVVSVQGARTEWR